MIKISEEVKNFPNYNGKDEYDKSEIVHTDSSGNPLPEHSEPYKFLFIVQNGIMTLPSLCLWNGKVMINTNISIEDIK